MTIEKLIIGFSVSLFAGFIAIHLPILKLKSNNYIELNQTLNKRKEKIDYFILYVISFIIIASSFYCPMFFNGGFKSTIDLNKTKLGISYILNKDDLFVISVVYASILYLPILYISTHIGYLYQWIQKSYSNIQINAIRGIVTIFFSFLLGSTIYYILNVNLDWWDSVKFIFLILLIPFLYTK